MVDFHVSYAAMWDGGGAATEIFEGDNATPDFKKRPSPSVASSEKGTVPQSRSAFRTTTRPRRCQEEPSLCRDVRRWGGGR